MTRPHLRVVSDKPLPAFVPSYDPPRPSAGPVVLMWVGIVAVGWCAAAGAAWTAYAVLRLAGVVR